MAEPTQRELTLAHRDRVQGTAKWLIASSSAVAAALIAGSQLSSLGKLDICAGWVLTCTRLPLAGLGVAVGLGGVAGAIWVAARLFVPKDWTAEDLAGEEQKSRSPLTRFFLVHRKNLQGFTSLTEMNKKVDEAIGKVAEAQRRARDARILGRKAAQRKLAAARAEQHRVFRRAQAVIQIANKVWLEATFTKALRRLLIAALITAAGILLFAWAANPPASSKPMISLRGATLRGVVLTGTVLKDVDLRDADMRGANLTGTDLRGSDLSSAMVEGVVWSHTLCPDGTDSDSVGGSCLNHLTP
jgi:hypothetical protein